MSHLSLPAFQLPLLLPAAAPAAHTATLRPRHAASRRPTTRRPVVRAAQTASKPSVTATPPPSSPSSNGDTPYPKPAGIAGELAALVKPISSIPGVFRTLATHPQLSQKPALIDDHHGPSVTLTYAQLDEAVRRMAAGLWHLGLRPRDNVSFFSENSHRWFILDQAIMTCGAAAAVRGVAAPVPELLYIYSNSESRALFVEDLATLERLVAGGLDHNKVDFIVLLFGDTEPARKLVPEVALYSFEDLSQLGRENPDTVKSELPSRDDMATLLYTSGTTGHPKGVVLTHGNILTQLEFISLGSLDPTPGEVFVSILPCWHVFERTAAYWCLGKGVTLVYSNKRSFRDDLAKYRPHLLISVPRVFENLHSTIMGRLRKASPLRRALFSFFMSVSLAFVYARRRLQGMDVHQTPNPISKIFNAVILALLAPFFGLANMLVWRKIRAGVGGRLRICLSGGGTIAQYLEDFFECASIDICVGYGMTETSPVIANRFGQRNVRGSTGMAMPVADVKIVDRDSGELVPRGEQGVLLARTPSVFREYWRNEEATKKAIDSEGFFDTGDLAYISHGGDIVISGRSKDVIVLSNGENIEPAPIEDAVAASDLIDQVMLVGQDQRALGALVVPKLVELQDAGVIDAETKARLEGLKKGGDDARAEIAAVEQELSEDGALISAIRKEVRTKNLERVNYTGNDNVAHVRIVLQPFSVENGMMTQTLKIKKDIVSKTYAKEIEKMYSH